jgi:hypothetical protein
MGEEGRPAKGKGEGRPSLGGKGVAAKKGQKGEKATTSVSLREKRNDATDDSDLASNGPQPFSHIHATRDVNGSDSDRILQISVRNHIRGWYQYPPAPVPTGRNLYPCPCPSDFGRVSDIRRIMTDTIIYTIFQ